MSLAKNLEGVGERMPKGLRERECSEESRHGGEAPKDVKRPCRVHHSLGTKSRVKRIGVKT